MATRWYDAFKARSLWHLLKEAAFDWSHDRAPRLGAALAYYTVFSIVPLLIVIIALIGLFFGEDAAQSAIMGQISSLVGEQSAAAIKDMIQRAEQPSTGLVATVVAVVTLLFGASGVFGELQALLTSVTDANRCFLGSEEQIIDVPVDRGICCHVGGDIVFDADGNLYLSTGDDTNPFESDGYTPIDEREGRNPAFDAQRTSANTNDLRGKILRINPLETPVGEDGGVEHPDRIAEAGGLRRAARPA